MTPRNRRRLGVLVGIAFLLPLLGAASAASSPIDDKKAEAARLEQQLNAQGERISALDEQYNQAQLRLQQTQASLSKAQADLRAADQRFAVVRSRLSEAAVDAYMHGGNTQMIEQLVKSNGRDLAIRQQYVQTAASDQQQALDDLRAAREDLDARRSSLEKNQQDAKAATDKLAGDRAAIEKAVASQQATLSQVKGELATLVAQQEAARQAADRARAAADLARPAPSKPARGAPPPPAGPPPPVGKGAGAAIAAARSQIGKPYQWGAAGPDSYDCSGLVMWSWAHGGVSLPHSTYAQWDVTTHVPPSAMQPGDILFFGSDLHHNALYAGGGTMIEAPHTGAFVREVPLRTSDLYGVGRVSG